MQGIRRFHAYYGSTLLTEQIPISLSNTVLTGKAIEATSINVKKNDTNNLIFSWSSSFLPPHPSFTLFGTGAPHGLLHKLLKQSSTEMHS